MKKICFLYFLFIPYACLAQDESADTFAYKTIRAGAEYKKSNFHQWLWGRNRRREWTTPVTVPVLWLDKEKEKLIPYKKGGGNESKTLRLKSTGGKEYTLHSINKSRSDVVLPDFKNTFVQDIINDGISMSYPYGAFALPVMENAAGIYHSIPRMVYVPRQPALDSFNDQFGNNLYLLEQRLDGDWSDADNLGNFVDFDAPEDLVARIQNDNSVKLMQFEFIKARLFDMLIADWDRHEDNWRWGTRDTSGVAVYYPVPRDRDQAFYTHNGVLIDRVLSAAGLSYMQNFNYDIPDIWRLNFEEGSMDRFFSNEMTKEDWIHAAKSLQQLIADSVIQSSVEQLPPEIFKISGDELIKKLIARREKLVKYAIEYYLFLAQEVEVTGSRNREYFEVKRINPSQTVMKVFGIDSFGQKMAAPFYSRTFNTSETKEVRIYGIDGNDVYAINGTANKMRVQIIGGPSRDSITETDGTKRNHVYDDEENILQTKYARLHIKNDSSIHAYEYDSYNYNSSGFAPSIFFNNQDRLYVGFGYGFKKYGWRRKPYATKQLIDVHYSLSQNAFSSSYTALYPQLFAKWNLAFSANYDAIRWTNFYGLGNETSSETADKNFYRIRTREWLAKAGINKNFGKSNFSINAFFQSVKILNDTDRFVVKIFVPFDTDALENNNYAGAQFAYTYLNVDDSIVPLKGISFSGEANYISNLSHGEFFQKYSGKLQLYIPLFDKFSMAIRNGGAAIIGDGAITNSAEFYEHAILGGPENMRGFRRERFWGKTAFFNSNELRYITNVRTHFLNAKAGLLVFFDDGKVWIPNENSTTLHTAYGCGIMFAPFNLFSGTITYGRSGESSLIQFRINKLF